MKKILIVLLFVGTYSATFAQQPGGVLSDKTGWHKIAETIVDFTRERDEVAILGADRFAAIKFRVTDAPIDFIHAEIFYEKGDSQYVALRSPIAAPGETRAIDLKNGAERDLKKISFVYKTAPNRGDDKAHVEIWGLKTNADKNDNKSMDKDKDDRGKKDDKK